MRYYLSLGSNLGRRPANLAAARARLEAGGVSVVRASSVYRTEPVDVPDQPWFLNQVIEVRTSLAPHDLLALAKAIEKDMKRAPSIPRGPRKIDIDILLAGPTVLRTRLLTIPHPRLARRNFVLIPLMEIAPRAVHPGLRKTVRSLAAASPDRAGVFAIRTRPRRKSN
jgi:2-amino-4-hydroxy-6-hydroxymethyldihydropteridine diphosphokinase